jgi:glucose/arabinose dehydrogenase
MGVQSTGLATACAHACEVLLFVSSLASCSSAGDGERAGAVSSPAFAISSTCDGFPRLDVETPPGVCVGIAATGFRKIRGIGELSDGDLVVADMGSWAKDDGSIWRLHRVDGVTFERRRLLDAVDRPASIAIGRDGLVYVGTASAIVRLDPAATTPVEEVVIAGLPSLEEPPEANENHPLKAIAFDPHEPNALYVTVGSGSNVCSDPVGQFPYPCPELDPGPGARAEVRRYSLRREAYEVVASGLRNPFALAASPRSGLLLVADNGRDQIDALDPSLTPQEGELPHEALDVIFGGDDDRERHRLRRGRHLQFGWPYCYDDGKRNPEYRQVDCRAFARPALLLPGHAAPLGMAFYTKRMFPPAYRGSLLVTYHGYREHGHRLVLIPTNGRGEPIGAPLDVIRGWNPTAATAAGQPFAVLVAKDGAIFVTNDDHGDLLRVAYDPGGGDGLPLPPLGE